MDNLIIFKFTDRVDGHHAFIISTNEIRASSILSELTSIPFYLADLKRLDSFPKIQEFFTESNNPIYRNDILPF